MCAALSAPAWGDLLFGIGANNEMAEARIGIGDPNTGYAGFWGEWDSRFPEDVAGVGGFGVLDVTRYTVSAVAEILAPPNAWWQLLETLGGRSYLIAKAGAIDLPTDNPRAYAAPGLGIGIGPIAFEQFYRFVEGGESPELKSGYGWELMAQKAFKLK